MLILKLSAVLFGSLVELRQQVLFHSVLDFFGAERGSGSDHL